MAGRYVMQTALNEEENEKLEAMLKDRYSGVSRYRYLRDLILRDVREWEKEKGNDGAE